MTEDDLRAFRPLPVSDQTLDQIAASLTPSRPSVADRFLAATLSVASLAACLIVGLLLYQATLSPMTPAGQPSAAAPGTPTLANPQSLLAQANFHN